MSLKTDYESYLMHYGVPGMEWGKHKKAKVAPKSSAPIVGKGIPKTGQEYQNGKVTNATKGAGNKYQGESTITKGDPQRLRKQGLTMVSGKYELRVKNAIQGVGNKYQGESTVLKGDPKDLRKQGMTYEVKNGRAYPVNAAQGVGNKFQGESTVTRNEDPNAWKKNLEAANKKLATKKVRDRILETKLSKYNDLLKKPAEPKEKNLFQKVFDFIGGLFRK